MFTINPRTFLKFTLFFCVWILPFPGAGLAQTPPDPMEAEERALLARIRKPFTGDLPAIREKRIIRVLVNHSKTNFFFADGGGPGGFEFELLTAYEKELNKGIKDKTRRITMYFIPTPFDQLPSSLEEGLGDIAAAGLTITPEREKNVHFSTPYISNVHEVVVVNREVEGVNHIDDLSGRIAYVRSGSSYVEHLEALNRRFDGAGAARVEIREADPSLSTEDILELVNAGVVKLTIVDHHIADAWSEVLPDIVVRKDLTINSGGGIGWAVRKNNPRLLAHMNAFIKRNKKGTLLGNIFFKRYYKESKWIRNPNTEKEREKLKRVIDLFEKYGKRYGFSWVAIAAQAYQESGLDQDKKSNAGAIGIMQVLPGTAADKSVAIGDIHILENNIHAGVKYLNFLRKRYFNKPGMEPAERVNFAWAAYNAGPARINMLRRKARKRGFDPNKWFYNVEKIAGEVIGRETVEYVSNINKYFIAMKLYLEKKGLRETTLEAMKVEGAKRK